MLFNSFTFVFFFLPIVFGIYFFLNRFRLTLLSKGFLVLSSLFFYSWWNILYLPLIIFSMIFNFSVGRELGRVVGFKSKKLLLTMGVISNLALLGYFKYSDFLISNINFVFDSSVSLLNLTLPLAISFFTFQQIAYLVDSYRGEVNEVDLLNYSLFVTFFPQLIAGPIVHHSEMMPQFVRHRTKVLSSKNVTLGIFVFAIGLFKKVVIADTFAVWASTGFDVADKLYFIEAWITSLSYTFQLYFDFSGYADMAIGIALMFNIRLPINFNSPYKSLDIQQFWRSWHMTLSRFLRDYIYIPLGGNRTSELKTQSNLLITFMLGGVWHGAGWTFIVWGVMHGLALVVHRVWQKGKFRLNKFFAWFVTFNFVNIAWVFFRATSFDDAIKVLRGMFLLEGINLPRVLEERLSHYPFIEFSGFLSQVKGDMATFVWLFVGLFVVTVLPNTEKLRESFKPSVIRLVFIFAILTYAMMSMNKSTEFLYFNF